MKWNQVPFLDVVKDITAGNRKFQSSEYMPTGSHPIIDQGEKDIAGYTDAQNIVSRQGPVVIFGDHTKKLQYVDHDFCLGADGVKVLSPTAVLNTKYLFYYLQTVHLPDVGYSRHYKFLKDCTVPLPPLHIQELIADTLDKADALRRKDQELLQKYDQLAQAIFYDMFGDPVRNEKGWNISSIRDVCTFSQGVQIPLEEQSTEYRSGLYRFLRISDYTQTVEPRYVSLYDRKAYVQKDDIVMVRYGASAGYVGTGYEGILANNLFKLGFERATLTSEFLYFYLNSTYVRAFITEVAFGAAMPALSFKVFDNLNIILPPVKLQERFSEIIQLIRRSSTNVYKSQNLSNLTFETTSVSFFS